MQDTISIVSYIPQYQSAFQTLNEAWILRYFSLEAEDQRVLNHPDEHIIKPGGQIFVALLNDQPVGVCPLIKMRGGKHRYELAKMAVSPKAQGKRIGWLLAQHVIAAARSLGATKIHLESNTPLQAAVSLHNKLGFKKSMLSLPPISVSTSIWNLRCKCKINDTLDYTL